MKRNRICVVMPTRARPAAQLEALASIIGNSAGFTDVILAVDADDERKLSVSGPNISMFVSPVRKPMLHLLNDAVMANLPYYDIFGFTGDDVLYQTKNWDIKVWNTLKHGIGVVYGDDGIQHDNLPTHPWFSAAVPKALGYASPPCLEHYYFDNFLKWLAAPLGMLYWRSDISTFHRHHSVGGLPYDKVYQEAERIFANDQVAFGRYVIGEQETNIKKLRGYAEDMRLTGGLTASLPGNHTPTE